MEENKVFNVLFLCTGNSARSIMAEALVTTMGKGRFKGYSAGSHPAGQVHPLTLELVEKTNYPTTELRSKNWGEFAQPDAPQMDFVFTVCDNAAGEICPLWPGQPLSAHWGFADPAAFKGTEEQKREFFHKIFRQIVSRMNVFVSLPLHMLERNAIQREIDAVGRMPVATEQ